MTKQTFVFLFLAGLPGLFSCNSKNDNKTTQQDSTSKEQIEVNKVLYTTPTIPNTMPDFKEKTDSGVIIHEGYWRQFEFVSKDQKNSIDKEFVKIQDIMDNYKIDSGTYGYKKVAVRDLIPQPMSVDFSKLISYFPPNTIKLQGLGIENNPGQVRNGFFFSVEGISYFGILDNGKVKTFCIYSADSDAEMKEATVYLSTLLSTEKLYLVSWEGRKLYDETTIITQLAEE